jgi:hypothetical protein
VWSTSNHNAKYRGEDLPQKTAGGHDVWRPAANPPLEEDRPSAGGGGTPGGDSEPWGDRCWDRYRSSDGGITWVYEFTWCESLQLTSKVNGQAEETTSDDYSPGKDPTVVILAVESLPENLRARVISNPGRAPAAVIVVPRATVTDVDLSEAFTVLNYMRKHKNWDREFARADVSAPRRNVRLSSANARTYGGYIASFSKAPEVDVPNVGKGLAVEVYIPRWK